MSNGTMPTRLGAAKSHAAQFLKRDFEPSWRYVFNLPATLAYRRQPPLRPEAARVVADLHRDGVARTSVAALLGEDAELARLQARTEELIGGQAEEIAARRRLLDDEQAVAQAYKPFLVELLGTRPQVDPTDPLVEFVRRDEVAGVAAAYAGMQLRIRDLNVWLNLAHDGAPTSSQLWHHDLPEDHKILKIFVNLADVDDGAGPLQYVRGSHRTRTRGFDRGADGLAPRLSAQEMDRLHPPAERATSAGPAGTITFADTRGIHRGGHALSSDRVLLHGLYASNSSVRFRVLSPAPGVQPQALPDFALVQS